VNAMVNGSVIQRGGRKPKLDRGRGEWIIGIEQAVDEEQAGVLL
jgi:hypothetical protein